MPGIQKFTYWEISTVIFFQIPQRFTLPIDLMVDYQLAQLIKEPTRVNAKSQTLIDVFITNKEDNISHSEVYTLSISDHNLIYAVRKIGLPRGQPKSIQSRNFKHFREENFLTDLKNVSWPVIKSGMEMNSA